MKMENVRVEKNGMVATVTLDRPKVLNALNAATFAELSSVFDELEKDAAVRVVLLTGAGERAFAAGADIRELAIAETLRLVDEGLDLPLDLALLREADRFGHLCDTADKAEGTSAFLEKRKPVWKGE
jgi:enoyl-CoA hydratase/carnithine racemase